MKLKSNNLALLGVSLLTFASISAQQWSDDDVYSVKEAVVPIDCDLNNDTDYATFVYNKQKDEKITYSDNNSRDRVSFSSVGFAPFWFHNKAYQGTGYAYRCSTNWMYAGYYLPVVYGYSTQMYSNNSYSNYYGNGFYGNVFYGGNGSLNNGNLYANSNHIIGSNPRSSISGYGGVVSRGTAHVKTQINTHPHSSGMKESTIAMTPKSRTGSISQNFGSQERTSSNRVSASSGNRIVRPESSTSARNGSSGPVTRSSGNVGVRTSVGTGTNRTVSSGRVTTTRPASTGVSVGRTGGGSVSTGGVKTVGRR